MKKKFTILLLFVTVFVWGLIIYRLMMNEEPQELLSNKNAVELRVDKKEPTHHTLIASYRDPFYETSDQQMPEREISFDVNPAIEPYDVPAPEPIEQVLVCRYKGVIINHSSEKTITLIESEGKDIMLEEGDTQNGITLLKNHGTYIVVRLVDGTTQSIYK